MTEEMTAFKEYEQFAFRLDNDVLNTDVDIRFTPNGTGTHIKASNTAKGKNMLWRSLFVLMKSSFAQNDQNAYNQLKKVVEEAG